MEPEYDLTPLVAVAVVAFAWGMAWICGAVQDRASRRARTRPERGQR